MFKKSIKTVWIAFVVLSALSWAFLKMHFLLGPVQDFYHESEYFGNLAVFLKTHSPFQHSYFIHGIGIDGLASYWGHLLASNGNTIMMIRLVRFLQGVLAWIGSFWIIWELVLQSKTTHKITSFTVLVFLFLSLNDTYYSFTFGGEVPARQGLFALQIAVMLNAFRRSSPFSAALSGFLAIAGLAYSYSFGGILFLALIGIFVLLTIYRNEMTRVWIGLGTGFIVGLLFWSSYLGWSEFKALFEQVYLLSQWGKDVQNSIAIHPKYFIQVAITHSLALVLLVRKWRSPETIEPSHLFTVLFLFPMAFVHLDYGMHYLDHWFWSSATSLYLLFAVGLWILDSAPSHDRFLLNWSKRLTVIISIYSLVWAFNHRRDMSISAAVERARYYSPSLKIRDELMFPSSYIAMKDLSTPFLKNEECLFVFRSQDVLFNFLLNQIPCTRFSTFQIANYMAKNGKREFVRDELAAKTSVVFLVPSDGTLKSEIDFLFKKTTLLVSTQEFSLFRGYAAK